MNLTESQFQRIKDLLPRQRGNVRIDNRTFLAAILYILENGCKWRALPKEFGQWSTVYKRFRRWSENGVLERVLTELNEERLKDANVSVLSLDSTCVKASPDATGALKKRKTGDRQDARR